jgi:hypothetical protein
MMEEDVAARISRVAIRVSISVDFDGNMQITDEEVEKAFEAEYPELALNTEYPLEWEVVDYWEVDANGNIRG